MMEKITPIPAYFSAVRSLADGSLRLTIDTQDMDAITEEAKQEIFHKLRKSGFFLFVEARESADLDSLDIPDVVPEFKGDKSPSQRLRAILYRMWEQRGLDDKQKTFAVFYAGKMEELCNHFKSKLI